MSDAAAVSILLAAIATYIGVLLLWYILQIIAYWKIFTKAGEAGWKSIIPFYNGYIQYKISWDAKVFWIVFAGTVIGTLMMGSDSGIISVIGMLFSLISTVLGLIGFHKLSKAFGHGIGFTLGLIFLNPIFMLILGLGGSEYQGPQ